MLDENSPRAGTYMNLVRPDTSTSVLVLGDSFCRIYQLPEPQSLGESSDVAGKDEADGSGDDSGHTKRLLPGSAGFPSHLALAMGTTVDYIVSDGCAATDVRRQLSTNAEILEGKKIVIWEFVERDIALGAKGWQDVPLPPEDAGNVMGTVPGVLTSGINSAGTQPHWGRFYGEHYSRGSPAFAGQPRAELLNPVGIPSDAMARLFLRAGVMQD